MYRSPNGRKYNQANGGTRGSITFSIGQDGSTIVLSKMLISQPLCMSLGIIS